MINKKISFYFLCIFLCVFPMLEGAANQYGSMGAAQLGGVLAAIWAIQTILAARIKMSATTYILLVFVIWMVMTVVWSRYPLTTLKIIPSYIMAFAFYLIVFDLITTRKDVLILISCYSFGVIVLSLTALSNIISLSTYAELSNRYSADGTDPNNFGMMLVISIPLLYIVSSYADLKLKLAIYFIFLLFAFLIISSASRAASVSLAFVLISVLIWNTSFKKLIYKVAAICFFSIIFYNLVFDFVPVAAYDRLLNGLISVGSDDRFNIWEEVLSGEGLSIFGAGGGVALDVLGIQAHNTFLSALFEGGVIGLLLWLLFWGGHAVYLYGSWKKENGITSLFLIISFIALLVASSTLNWEFRKPLYFMMAIYSGWHSVLMKEQASSHLKKKTTLAI